MQGVIHLGRLARPLGRLSDALSPRAENVYGIWNRIFDFDSFYTHFLNTSRFDDTNFCGAADFFAKSALFHTANIDSLE